MFAFDQSVGTRSVALAVLGRNDLKRTKQNPCKENCLVTGQVRPGPWKGSLVVRWLFAFARSKMIKAFLSRKFHGSS